MVLAVLNSASLFMADLTPGEDLPPAYRTGTQLLFNLAFVMWAFMAARDEADGDDSQ